MRSRLASLLLLGFALAAFADDFRDFRIPDYRASSLSTSFFGGFDRGDLTDEYSSTNYQNWDGSVSGALLLLRESDRFRSITQSSLSMEGEHETYEAANYGSQASSSSDRNRRVNEGARAHWDGWFYPAASPPLGFYGSTGASASTGQSWDLHHGAWSTSNGNYVHIRDRESRSYSYSVSLTGGPAFGRTRDVTEIYNVIIAEQRLISDGVLNGPLHSVTRQKLAGLFYDKLLYRHNHQRYLKLFWRDIENALRSDPSFDQAKFDSYELYHMTEPTFSESRFARSCGWTISPIIRASHRNDTYRSEYREFVNLDSSGTHDADTLNLRWSRSVRESDNVVAGLKFSYANPLSLHWQLGLNTECLFDVEPPTHGFRLMNRLNVDWEIADRWHARFMAQHDREQHEIGDDVIGSSYYRTGGSGIWQLTCQGDVNYFIEDKTLIYATVAHLRGKNNTFFGSGSDGDESQTIFGLGLTYYFFGAASYYHYSFVDSYVDSYVDSFGAY